MTPPPELREEVVRAMASACGVCLCSYEDWLDHADAAIAATLAWVDKNHSNVQTTIAKETRTCGHSQLSNV